MAVCLGRMWEEKEERGRGIEQSGEKQPTDWICELNQAWIPECDWAHMVEGEKHTHTYAHTGWGEGNFFN